MRSNLIDSYRSKLRIDRHELDTHLQEHPAIYMDVQEAYIQALSIRDANDAAVDEEKALADARVRRKLVDKSTEAQVKSMIVLDEAYAKALEIAQRSKTEAAMLGALVAAFQERGRMLAKLADLYISGYWSQNSARGSSADLRDQRAEEGRAAMTTARRTRISKSKGGA